MYGSLSSQGAYLRPRPEPGAPASATAAAVSPSAGPGVSSARLKAEQLAAKRLAEEKELAFWNSIKDSNDKADIRAYLEQFPKGTYAALLQGRLKRLGGSSKSSEPQALAPAGAAAPTQQAFPPPAPAGPETVEASIGLERTERRRIQEGLAALGFDPGPADGLFGRGTRDAIGKWQFSQSATMTGYLDAEAAKTLLAAGEAAARAEAKREARERAAMRPGRVFRDCEGCPEMLVVSAGSFTMGSPWHNIGRPQHLVTIREPFAVGKYEVTFSEWDACVSAGGCGHRPGDESWGRGRRPVMNVSWKDARSYVRWLSRKTGKRYRLLSEAEWEYAARAGTTGPFHTGSEISTDWANYNANIIAGGGRKGLNRQQTVPVGSFSANGFGVA